MRDLQLKPRQACHTFKGCRAYHQSIHVMLQLTPQSTIFIYSSHIDFRKGIDGLASVCKQKMAIDPFGGALFVFYNRDRKAMKILAYDGQGFCLFAKRLSNGKFVYRHQTDHEQIYKQICYRALNILINNGNPTSANLGSNWRSQGVVMPREEFFGSTTHLRTIQLDPI